MRRRREEWTADDARMLSCICVYKLQTLPRFVCLSYSLGLVRCFAEFLKRLLIKDW